jgi:CCR4-NOT transcriptional regulation complex NOT5 subunit
MNVDKLENLNKNLKKQIKKLNKLQKNTKTNNVNEYYEIKEVMNNNDLNIDTKMLLIKQIIKD